MLGSRSLFLFAGLTTGAGLLAWDSNGSFSNGTVLSAMSLPAYFESIAISAFGAAWLCAGLLGWPGGLGWVVGGLASILVTGLTAILACCLTVLHAVDLEILAVMFVGMITPLNTLWLGLMIGAHIYARRVRADLR